MRTWRKTSAGKWAIFTVCFFLVAGLLYWIVADDWARTYVETAAVTPGETVGGDGYVLEQTFRMSTDTLEQIRLTPEVGAGSTGTVQMSLNDGQETLFSRTLETEGWKSGETVTVDLADELLASNASELTLGLEIQGEGIRFWMGNSMSTGKMDVTVQSDYPLMVNGEVKDGQLVMVLRGSRAIGGKKWFWPVAGVLWGLSSLLILVTVKRRGTANPGKINRGVELCRQYKYLLKTLVVRDFKVRYKASVLGMLWSFLNPLLMTFVYYFVFSTIFKSSIENFPVYLMSGIVLYNYFSEATNLGMQSIVGNAGLITKVYMPKYIFPISKALSSAINLAISLIPLLIMMAITGVGFHKSLLLLPLVILFLVVFCIGVSLILSACMVYFRDIQFLWGILLTILNFFSPIFYPESIIPAKFLRLYHLNPLYQYLYFMRTIILGGISPTPVTYLYCALASGVTLAVGLLVFRRAQSRFVLHL